MAGRGRAIHVFLVCVGKKTWVAGPSPAMTVGATHKSSSMSFGITHSAAEDAATSCTRRYHQDRHDTARPDRRRPDRQRQIGAGAGRWPSGWAARSSMPTPCRCYRELRVLTARPTPEDEARVPHALYGVRPAAEAGSVAWWREAALAAMAAAREAGRLPILTGGTGLYFASLTEGLADIPRSRPGRAGRSARAAEGDRPGRAACPPRRGRSGDRRPAAARPTASASPAPGRFGAAPAEASPPGRPPRAPPAPWRFAAILLDPPRAELRAAIAGRFAAMLQAGALEEVRALLALDLDPALPAMRAHGVPELAAHLRGETDAGGGRTRASNWSPASTPSARRPGSATTHWLTRHTRIRSMRESRVWTQFSERIIPEFWEFIESMG